MRSHTCRSGAAAVEFALVAPILCGLILGMIEVGRALQVQMALTNAVREACRAYADNITADPSGYQAGTSGCVQPFVTRSLSNANLSIDTSKVTVTSSLSVVALPGVSGSTMKVLSVKAAIPYSSVAYFPPFIINRNLTATATMKDQKP
jgi:Flp pilus assembly protein TadG